MTKVLTYIMLIVWKRGESMGIYIALDIYPNRISQEKWKIAFDETVRLLNAYSFMDKVVDEKNGLKYTYLTKSRYKKHLYEGYYGGWHIIDEDEEVELYDCIEAYLNNDCQTIWFVNTKGKRWHIYLLAMACLLTSYFPENIHVYGDITTYQCIQALNWINQILDRKIDMPIVFKKKELLERLKKQLDNQLLNQFYDNSLSDRDKDLGNFIRLHFSEEEIYQFYKNKFSLFHIKSYEFQKILREYLEMEFSFEDLIKMMKECRVDLNDLVEILLNWQLHIKDKKYMKHSELFDKVYENLFGFYHRPIQSYCSLDKMEMVLGGEVNVEELVNKEELRKNLCEEILEEDLEYDIIFFEQFSHFYKGCKVMKELDEMMRENIRFLKKNAQSYYQHYLTLNRKERENWFIKNNQYMLLSKEMWDHIFERVMDNVYVFRLIALFCVDCYQSNIYQFIKMLVSNLNVLDYYWDEEIRSDENV